MTPEQIAIFLSRSPLLPPNFTTARGEDTQTMLRLRQITLPGFKSRALAAARCSQTRLVRRAGLHSWRLRGPATESNVTAAL